MPAFDLDAGLEYDAKELGFPIRHPEVPELAVQLGEPQHHLRQRRRRFEHRGVRHCRWSLRAFHPVRCRRGRTRPVRRGWFTSRHRRQQIGTRDWTVYGGDGVEALWVSDFGDVRILIGGSGTDEEFTELATTVGVAEPLTP